MGRRAVLGWTGAALGVGVVTACTSTVDWSEPTVASATPTPPATVTELLGTEGFMVAHRGGSRSWPEMTEVAYDQAVDAGLRALEVSVHRTSDGVFVCCHDPSTLRVAGVDHIIAQTPWADLQPLKVTAKRTTDPGQPDAAFTQLETVLKAHAADRVIVLEDKSYAHGAALLEWVRAIPGHEERVVWKVHGPSGDRAVALGAEAGLRTFGYFFPANLEAFAQKAPRFDIVGIDVECTDDQIRAAVDVGKPVLAHVIASTAERDRMRDLGCRGLMVADVRALTSGS